MNALFYYLNLPRFVCDHVVGREHTNAHRMLAGAGVMIFGVIVAQSAHELPLPLDTLGDLIGYLIHGFGAMPYVDAIVAVVNARPRELDDDRRDR